MELDLKFYLWNFKTNVFSNMPIESHKIMFLGLHRTVLGKHLLFNYLIEIFSTIGK
jgi:hypothetical protein